MFSRVFSIVMTPAGFLMGAVAFAVYFWLGIAMLVDGDTLAGILWLIVWGHIVSVFIGALTVLPLLAILALLVASVAWLISLIFGLQKRGVESLPFTVTRKGPPDVFSH